MLLTAVHLGHVFLAALFIAAKVRRRWSAWLRDFCELAQSLLASAHSTQRLALSLQHRLSTTPVGLQRSLNCCLKPDYFTQFGWLMGH